MIYIKIKLGCIVTYSTNEKHEHKFYSWHTYFSHKGNRLAVDTFKLGNFPFQRNLLEDNPLIENQNGCIDIRTHNEQYTKAICRINFKVRLKGRGYDIFRPSSYSTTIPRMSTEYENNICKNFF